ncbi:phage tail tip lysozyme [Burkholderia gladioli]|uniref:phage tail tip lysozyme n=1 Tax=Burkholderia gladioli TaxID=28095 RepID=UPI003AFB5331
MPQEFVIRIRADDAATATINKIQAALGKVTAPVEKAQKRFANVGTVGLRSFEKLTKSLDSAARAAHTLVDKVVELVPGLAAIGAAGTVAGVVGLTTRFGSFGFALNKTSKLLGMNAQDLAAWHVAAKRAGVSASEFDSAMASSQSAIRSAAYGQNKDAMVALQKLHVQISRNTDGTVADYQGVQQQIMKALAKIPSVQGQRAAADAFGMGALLPMIQQGTYAADRVRAVRKGLVPTADEVARASQFTQDINDLEDSVNGLGNSIGSTLIPVLDPVVKRFAQWLDEHRAEIADKLADAVQRFVNWLSKVDWDGLSRDAKTLWDNLGGAKGAMIAIAAITFSGPIAAAIRLAGLIAGIGSSAVALAANPAAAAILGLTYSPDLNKGEDAKLADIRRKEQWALTHGGWTPEMASPDWKPPEEGSPDKQTRTTSRDVIAQLQGMGWSKAAATGIATNLFAESKFNAGIFGDNGKAYGIAQWHDDRQKMFAQWSGHQIFGSSVNEQLRFLDWELRNGDSGARTAGARLQGAGSSSEAARIVSQFYERPADAAGEANRRAMLASMFDGVAGDAAPAAVAPGSAGGAPQSTSVAGSQKQSMHITLEAKNLPQGMRVEAKTEDGNYLPTKVNYRMDGL